MFKELSEEWSSQSIESEEWSSQSIFQFKQLERRSLKKIRASTGFEPVTSAIHIDYCTVLIIFCARSRLKCNSGICIKKQLSHDRGVWYRQHWAKIRGASDAIWIALKVRCRWTFLIVMYKSRHFTILYQGPKITGSTSFSIFNKKMIGSLMNWVWIDLPTLPRNCLRRYATGFDFVKILVNYYADAKQSALEIGTSLFFFLFCFFFLHGSRK